MGEMGKRPRKGGSLMARLLMTIRMILMMALLSAPFPQPGLASDIPSEPIYISMWNNKYYSLRKCE